MLKYSEHLPVNLSKELKEYGCTLFLPTYSEVFEWFASEKGIIITLEPFFTMALGGHTAYTWKVSYPDGKLPVMVSITEMDKWKKGSLGGSFCPTADAAIEFAMTLGDRRFKYIEVDINTL